MNKTKLLIEGALISAIAAIIQLIPVFFSELLIFFTLGSTFPIYLITRKNYRVGLASYVTTAVLIMFFSVHEATIFIFTNGLVGVSLGYYDSILSQKILIIILTSSHLFISLTVLNFLIGIPVFIIPFLNSFFLIFLLILFSLVYISFYFYFIKYLLNRIKLFRYYIN